MVTASRFYQVSAAGPPSDPGVKSVGITVEDDAGWRHEQVVYIQAGSAAHELEQLDYAVENLMKAHGKVGPWRWL